MALVVDRLNGAELNEAGSWAAARTIGELLTSRLHFVADRARLPLAVEPITAPLFATGEPRSGTTLLHALLAEDADSRALRFWEVMYPSPPPGPADVDDPRRAQADADWREILDRIPPWIVSHPYNDLLGDGLPEGERTWAFDFRAMNPSAWWRVPLKIQDFPQDHRAVRPAPDDAATHPTRPPAEAMGVEGVSRPPTSSSSTPTPMPASSGCTATRCRCSRRRSWLSARSTRALPGRWTGTQYAEDTIEGSRANFHAYLTDPFVDDPRIHHVRYRDFVADPVATIGGFYDFAGLPFTTETERTMRDYLATNRSDRHGKFTYSTDVLPVPVEQLHDEFAAYRERFGIDIETRH